MAPFFATVGQVTQSEANAFLLQLSLPGLRTHVFTGRPVLSDDGDQFVFAFLAENGLIKLPVLALFAWTADSSASNGGQFRVTFTDSLDAAKSDMSYQMVVDNRSGALTPQQLGEFQAAANRAMEIKTSEA